MQTIFKNILAPTDFSKLAANAMTTAVEMCKRHKAQLHIMHVLENQVMVTSPATNSPVFYEEPGVETDAWKKLSDMAAQLREKHGLSVTAHLEFTNPVDAIKRKADELHCEFIIIGTHGTSGFRELFIGSTAFTLIKNTTIPVLTIPGKKKCREFGKILFPIRAAKGIIEKYDFISTVVKKNNAETDHSWSFASAAKYFNIEDRKNELLQLGRSLGTSMHILFRSEFHVCKNYAKEVLKIAKKEKS